ncbi:MAG: hypothetical protein ACPG49_09430 [Chitinophagales bacterium]
MMNIAIKQRDLAQKLFQIKNGQLLDEIAVLMEQTILKYKNNDGLQKESELEKLHRIAQQPTPYHIPIEQIAKKQGYSSEKLSEAIKSIDHSLFEDESLEDMLNDLTK